MAVQPDYRPGSLAQQKKRVSTLVKPPTLRLQTMMASMADFGFKPPPPKKNNYGFQVPGTCLAFVAETFSSVPQTDGSVHCVSLQPLLGCGEIVEKNQVHLLLRRRFWPGTGRTCSAVLWRTCDRGGRRSRDSSRDGTRRSAGRRNGPCRTVGPHHTCPTYVGVSLLFFSFSTPVGLA